MIFRNPLLLIVLAVVAAIAAWMLYRPGRRSVVVGSIRLWGLAQASLDRSAFRPIRAISASWILLFAGCVLCVLSAADPIVNSGRSFRTIGLAIFPSAELSSPQAMDNMRNAALAIVDRLDDSDRVQMLIPSRSGGEYVSPSQARRIIQAMVPLPIRSDRIAIPPAGADVQEVFCLIPAGTSPIVDGKWKQIEITTSPASPTIDAANAEMQPGGTLRLFASIGAHGHSGIAGMKVKWNDGERQFAAPNADGQIVVDVPACDWMKISITDASGIEIDSAFLARRDFTPIRLAILGDDLPMVRRFASASGYIEIADTPGSADVIVANKFDSLPAKPALVVKPPVSPPGWMLVSAGQNVVMSGVNVAADPLTEDVDFSVLAVRDLEGWRRNGDLLLRPILSLGDAAIILRSDLEASPTTSAADRRIYVAFDISTSNTNFAMLDAMPIFLDNAIRWLAGGTSRATKVVYRSIGSQELVAWRKMTKVASADDSGRFAAGDFATPGVYRDESGKYYAVSLDGLQYGTADVSAAAGIDLPSSGRTSHPISLWPALAAIAALTLLAGWLLRAR